MLRQQLGHIQFVCQIIAEGIERVVVERDGNRVVAEFSDHFEDLRQVMVGQTTGVVSK